MNTKLRPKTNSYLDEMKYRLANGYINKDDLLDFLVEGFIDIKQFTTLINYAHHLSV